MRDIDEHFLPGVSFTVDGETLPASELCWAMYASCGCVSGLHMMTEDTITESAAWKQMSGNAAMIKRDKARGFELRMAKLKGIDYGGCQHTPAYGYEKVQTPEGHAWAATSRMRTLHLVPLVELSKEDQDATGKRWENEAPRGSGVRVKSACGKAEEYDFVWSRKRYDIDNKIECASCLKSVAS